MHEILCKMCFILDSASVQSHLNLIKSSISSFLLIKIALRTLTLLMPSPFMQEWI